MICFSTLHSRPMVHEVLIAIFVTLTTPITLMLLARAALYRDRSEGSAGVPQDLESVSASDIQQFAPDQP